MTPLAVAIPVIVLSLLSAGLGVYWAVASWKIAETWLRLPDARAGVAAARRKRPGGSVCVVVPAHNEEATVGPLVESLKAQDHPGASFVLALDRCTDATEAAARAAIGGDARFEVVVVTDCPEEWAGKVHAAWAGVEASVAARGADYLLFTDADCRLDPRCLSATVALLEERALDLLSLFSTLDVTAWFEQVAQAAASFELARQYPLLRANDRDASRRRAFANGQFMLFRAGAYRSVGGHAAVRHALLEDIAFARLMQRDGRPAGLLLAGGMVRCKMYDTWAQFRKGWKRIYTESANRKAGRLRTSARRLVVLGCILPAAAAACPVVTLVGAAPGDWPLLAAGVGVPVLALGAWLLAMAAVHMGSRTPVWCIPLYPLGALLSAGILREAARDLDRGKATEWGGRTYQRQGR